MKSLKEMWNKPVTTKQKFYVGLWCTLCFFPLVVYLIWFDLVSFYGFWISSVWGAFMGWTVVTWTWRHDFKDEWKHKVEG